MEHVPPLITLTTDFGLTDSYVGQLKGALLKGCPSATLIDITHAVPAWDVVAAALTIHTSYSFFPTGTVHLIVVDPGVGGPRSLLVARGGGHSFVCPDNGILTFLLEDRILEAVYRLAPARLGSGKVSPTFHGRDIMAPVAAALAGGVDMVSMGESVPPEQIKQIVLPTAVLDDGRLLGHVLGIDHFGNVRTSIRTGDGNFAPHLFAFLEINGHRLNRLVTTYSEMAIGAPAVLVDSAGFLEIAANQASAATLIGCAPGDTLTVHCVHPSLEST
jgi:S-adenosylmethionine hydrolase